MVRTKVDMEHIEEHRANGEMVVVDMSKMSLSSTIGQSPTSHQSTSSAAPSPSPSPLSSVCSASAASPGAAGLSPASTTSAASSTSSVGDVRLTDAELMRLALDEAMRGVSLGEGGPFGAVVTRRGVVVSRAHNRVLQTNDPTAHAEVVAIRDACARLGRFSLEDCVLYTSCQPCPMCFAAAHWAKLPRCFYTATADDAARVGFDDRFLYDAIRGRTQEVKCEILHMEHDAKLDPFRTYEVMLGKGESSLY